MYMTYRISLPKLIGIDEDFKILLKKWLQKASNKPAFLRQILMNGIKAVDINKSIYSYDNTP